MLINSIQVKIPWFRFMSAQLIITNLISPYKKFSSKLMSRKTDHRYATPLRLVSSTSKITHCFYVNGWIIFDANPSYGTILKRQPGLNLPNLILLVKDIIFFVLLPS